MAASLEGGHSNEWLNKEELARVRRILGIPGITAVRVHKAARKKLQSLPTNKKGETLRRGRLSILIGEEAQDVFVVQETAEEAMNSTRKMPFLWKGMTVFTHEEERAKQVNHVYIQLPDQQLAKVRVEDVAETVEGLRKLEKEAHAAETFLLLLKQNGKELDPRRFSEDEAAAFEASDLKEWQSWLDNKSVRILDKNEARKVPKSKVFRLPLRYVRTNKGGLQGLIAKSRLVAPGHEDPQLGQFRTDAPTTTPLANTLTKIVAASWKWKVWCFDVETAFLSGKATSREVYVRAPKEGLPACRGKPAVAPFALLQVLKSIYGLTEAPRLWYLRAKEVFEEAGFQELRLSRSTFVLMEEEKDAGGNPRTCACCNLHVDDGFLAGDEKSPTFQRAFEKLKESFNVKAWICLQDQVHKYLGLETYQEKDYTVVESMKRYILETIKPISVKRGDKPDRRLTPAETTAFRSLIMQLRWPAQKVLSQVLYGVSALAQKVNEACVSDTKEANRLAELAISEAEAGRAERVYRAVDLSCPVVATYLDASLGKETGCRSQAGMMSFL